MKESGAVHCIDPSHDEPRYQSKILYSRLFGKGQENIYEFDDRELKEIRKKASEPKFEKSILAFHGVRMYKDAGRVKSFIEKGYFPKITSGVGVDDRKSTRLNSSHRCISYAVFCLKKKKSEPSTLCHGTTRCVKHCCNIA